MGSEWAEDTGREGREREKRTEPGAGWMWQSHILPVKNPSVFSQAAELGQRGISEHAYTSLLKDADVIDLLYEVKKMKGLFVIVMSQEFGFESYVQWLKVPPVKPL